MSDLPFLKHKRIASIIMAKKRLLDEIDPIEEAKAPLLSAAEDLIAAVHQKNPDAVMEALKAALEIIDQGEDSHEI